jgi:hypothetical protein
VNVARESGGEARRGGSRVRQDWDGRAGFALADVADPYALE